MNKVALIIAFFFITLSTIIFMDSHDLVWSSECSINCENGNASSSCTEGETCTCKCTQQGDPICWCEEN